MAKVALIGLDGMTFHLLHPLIQAGKLPFFKRITDAGVSAYLTSTENPVTPAAWVSMYTGKVPSSHGVYDFMHPVDNLNYPALRFTDSRTNSAKTLWEIASDQGKTSVSLNFFGMAPPRKINGFVLGGFVPWKHLRMNTEPSDYFDSLKSHLGPDYKLLGMDISEEKKIVSGLPLSSFGGWVQHHTERNRALTKAIIKLNTDFHPDILSLVYDGPDKIQHIFWRFLDPDFKSVYSSEEDNQIRDSCEDHYIQLDRDLETLAGLLGEDCNLVFASDHGFGPTVEVVYMNQILANAGLLHWSDSSKEDTEGGLAPAKLKDHMSMIDWRHTQIYAPTPSGNALYLTPYFRDHLSKKQHAYQDFIDNVTELLLGYKDTSGTSVFSDVVINWERYYSRPCPETSPDIIVKLRDGGFISVLKSSTDIMSRQHPEGTHRPNGIFIGHGPAFIKGQFLDIPLDITAITPLILALAHIDIPSDLASKVPCEVLSPDYLSNLSISYSDSIATDYDHSSGSSDQQHIDEGILLDQLKTLGYID